MTSHEFICQDQDVINTIFEGLYSHLKRHHGINITNRTYVGDRRQCTTCVAAWLLYDKDNSARFYVEYNADKNELNLRPINILEFDYKIPVVGTYHPKDDESISKEDVRIQEYYKKRYEDQMKADIDKKQKACLEEFLDKGWYSLKEDIDKKQADTLKRLREQLNGKPQPTLKSMINSSMDEIMSELASMKQKAQPTMDKMERVYKAMITELSKDD